MLPMLKRPGIVDLASLILVLALVFINKGFFNDPGVGWHLKTGELISVSRELPTSDPFLFTSADKSWISNQWLSDVIFYQVHTAGGWLALKIFCVCLIFIAFFVILYPLLLTTKARPLIVLGVWLLCLMQASVQWFCRPVLFSFLLFSLVFSLLQRVDNAKKIQNLFFILPVIFVIWANLHPGFVLGLMLVAVFSAVLLVESYREDSILKALGAIFLLLAPFSATLLNPYGLRLHQSILRLGQSNYFMNLNSEWLCLTIYKTAYLPFFVIILLAICSRLNRKEKVVSVFDAIIFFILSLMSFIQVRYLPFFSIVAGFVILKGIAASSKNLGNVSKKTTVVAAFSALESRQTFCTKYLYSALVLISLFVLSISSKSFIVSKNSNGFDSSYPIEIADYFKTTPFPIRAFHSPDLGGYLAYTLYPKKVFIDDRNELNGEDIYEDYFRAIAARPGWKEVFSKYQLDYAIVNKADALAIALGNDPNWSILIEGKNSTVLYQQHSSIFKSINHLSKNAEIDQKF
jgi:hypothetical protein